MRVLIVASLLLSGCASWEYRTHWRNEDGRLGYCEEKRAVVVAVVYNGFAWHGCDRNVLRDGGWTAYEPSADEARREVALNVPKGGMAGSPGVVGR